MAFIFLSLPKLPSPQMILVSPSFPFFPLYPSHTHTHTLFTDHPPPPWLPCIAYLTSLPLHLPSASVLAHVCANVTSIFHRQPLPVSRSLPSKIPAGLASCCGQAEWPGQSTDGYLVLQILHIHMQTRHAHAQRKAMCTYIQ